MSATTPWLTRRETFTHWAREQVRFSDTDALGHVDNLAFGAFAETGRCMFLKRFVEKGSVQRAMFLPATLSINFLGELHWPAAVDVGTGILAIGNSSFRYVIEGQAL
jgi:acyl-CoA thioester hydrolase